MKGFLKSMIATALVATTILSFAGCGNEENEEELGPVYIALQENGQTVLHKEKDEVYKLAYCDTVKVETECCGRIIYTNTNSAVIYEGGKKPEKYAYDFECGMGK